MNVRPHASKTAFKLSAVIGGLILLLISLPNASYATPTTIDRIAAIVDDNIIMESELNEKVDYFRNDIAKRSNQLPPDNILRQQVLERLILESIQLQMADRVGLRVTDDILNKTIEKIAQQNNMTEAKFRQSIEAEGQSYQSIREQIRRDLLISELRQKVVGRRVQITEQNIKTFMASELGKNATAANYRLGHILIALPAQADANTIKKTQALAIKTHQALLAGASFQETAVKLSDGQNALEGGDLGWRNASQLPSLFAEQAKSMNVGDVAPPIRSANGFHIIKLLDLRGGESHFVKQTRVRHILIKPNEIRSLDEAEALANKIRNDLLTGKEFAAMAKTFSEDPSSARNGGELDWITPGSLVPEFEKVMDNIQIGKISKPFLTQYGWHILEVLERREKDMGKEYKIEQARNFLSKRRYEEELESWIREIRQEAYVDIKS